MVETPIPVSSATRFNFFDQPQLRTDQTMDIIIQGIESWDITDIPLSPNNNPVITKVNLQNSYLVLYIDGEESVLRLPLIALHRVNNFADPFTQTDNNPFNFDNIMVDWTKSYIFTPTAYVGGILFSILLGVHYKKLPPGTMAKIKANEYAGYMNLKVIPIM